MSNDLIPLVSGNKVGAERFTLVKQLGQGGMGVVWLAQDDRLRKQVALKFLPPSVQSDPRALDGLRRETARAQLLTHPHIIRIHDLHEFRDENAFLSMEFISGKTFDAMGWDQPGSVFQWVAIREWIKQLCDALEYAHRKGVIHRDLKPANMMLDATDNTLKLADFGIAAVVSDSLSRVSVQSPTSGTAAYMSPQQINGEKPKAADDLYALGASLYHLLTSRPPFYTGIIPYQVVHTEPEPMSVRLADFQIQNDIPPHVTEVVMACLAKDPAQRPQSAKEVWDRLAAGDTAEPGAAEGPIIFPTIAAPPDDQPVAPAMDAIAATKPATDPVAPEIFATVPASSPTAGKMGKSQTMRRATTPPAAPEVGVTVPATTSTKKATTLAAGTPDAGQKNPFSHEPRRGMTSHTTDASTPSIWNLRTAGIAAVLILILSACAWYWGLEVPRQRAEQEATRKRTEQAALKAEQDKQAAEEQARLAADAIKRKLDAEAKARQEAEEKALREEQARRDAEAKLQETARLKAAAEEKALEEARQRLAAEDARLKAEAKTQEEIRLQNAAMAKAVEEEKQKAEAQSKALEDAWRRAAADEARIKAEARAQEETRTKNAAQMRALEEARKKAIAETKALDDKRQRAMEDERRLTAQSRALEEARLRAVIEAKAKPEPIHPPTPPVTPQVVVVTPEVRPTNIPTRPPEVRPVHVTPPPTQPGPARAAPEMVTSDSHSKTGEAIASAVDGAAEAGATVGRFFKGVFNPSAGNEREKPVRRILKGKPQPGARWTNSLGMIFAPVHGTKTLFSIYETRYKDYSAYAQVTSGMDNSWVKVTYQGAPVSSNPDHPVTMVSWSDAKAFCQWLTESEQRNGDLADGQSYRLPTDREWSDAVGLGPEQGNTPAERSDKIPNVYPWGTAWPPPPRSGNFADINARKRIPGLPAYLERYDDHAVTTAPVGKSEARPNPFGLFDMSGNVAEWCEDSFDGEQARVLRGGSWAVGSPRPLFSSDRDRALPNARNTQTGFRVVLGFGER
ncbi:MAG: SUMF1/EgtB/PvdO family nonheme iron enzyme [Verrucomicrobiota bacterium]